MIAGLETLDEGSIQLGGKDVTELPPRDRDIAMVFQDYALYPHMTITDNIGYPLKVRGVPKSDRDGRVADVAGNLQIGNLLARRPAQLSGGQQQRVAVARAVVHHAKVFLFDEPLSNLDAKLRLEARAFLKHLQREVGILSIYVTHDQAEAMALADRIVVMQSGEIKQIGSPLEIYRRPANTFVASFIGNPPMNLLPCSVDTAQRRVVFEDSPVSIQLPQDSAQAVQAVKPNDKITLGIRPEYIRISTEKSETAIPGQLYVIQNLGGEIVVNVRFGEALLSVRLFEEETPELPDQLFLDLDFEHVFFYGPDGNLLQ
jgi:ABC-type sugar transport system ATPase subunit